MAKKKEYSFADEAKRIMKRFPRRETDSIEKRDYEEAMTRLQQEQELARQELGLGEPQQMAGGGKMKYDGFNTTQSLPSTEEIPLTDNSNIFPDWMNNLYDNTIGIMDYNKPFVGGV